MNPWYSESFFLAASSPPVSLACVSDMFILFILLWIGRTVAYRGKRWSSLTFLCVVITEETAAALAGLYSLALFLSLSLSITTSYFCWGKYLHFSVAFPSCVLFGFFGVCELCKRLSGFFVAPVEVFSSLKERSVLNAS